LSHYGLEGHRINVRKPHENGDVESSHGHFKDRVDQALRLRGRRDFDSREAYVAFPREVTPNANRPREARFQSERDVLGPLPVQRFQVHQVIPLTVPSDCVMREQFRWFRLPLSITQQFETLRSGAFLDRHDNLLIFGRSGTGKTNRLCALGEQLARGDRTVLFTTRTSN
jgi:hypothetical protein